jgi:hypothetical protein
MRRLPVLLLALCLPAAAARAGHTPTDFRPDPRSVQRYGPAYRYPQAGWVVLHIEGEPYERGCQHGRLMAPEIAAHVRCFAAVQSPKSPAEGWKQTRTLVNALFLRRYDKEYLEEMKGIADGASAAGARFDNRPIDLIDIVALNGWAEIGTLDSALNATATGLEGVRFPLDAPRPKPMPKPERCSAFAATGPATADGKIVFGHITMFGLYPSLFYNVWLDVKPSKGHRVLMQTYPGGIQSGLDYYLNDAGLLVCETTIAQTLFDGTGLTVASRIRQALQYADSIDKAVAILGKANNGLYTNEWLLADVKTNEIAMYELGTHKSKLYRSSKNEWYGGTEGFYWGCNNTKDLQVRLETVASVGGRPANAVFRPSDRDKMWLRLYDRYKGKMDAEFGKLAFTTPPLAAYHSVDAKFTTTEMAKQLKTWALFGPPLGRTWEPTFEERQRYPEVRPLVSNPWAILHAAPPAAEKASGPAVVDLHNPVRKADFAEKTERTEGERRRREQGPPTVAAWHGTLLPASDADTWLAVGFASYERIVALEKALAKQHEDGKLTRDDRDRLALALFAYRADYEFGARAHPEQPLARTKAELRQNDWYRVASGKGVWMLHDLRTRMGAEKFDEMMDAFGRENAGKRVSTSQFRAHVEKAAGKSYADFFERWLNQPGLPALKLVKVAAAAGGADKECKVEVRLEGGCPGMVVSVTLETAHGEVTRTVTLADEAGGSVTFEAKEKPTRVVVDKYGQAAKSNGGPFAVGTFFNELETALIVYGTADELATNKEAAELLQKALLQAGPNITVAIKTDRTVTEEELRTNHLLLIGRPDSNTVVGRWRDAWPVSFGSRSFAVRGEAFAHADSAVIAAAENPANKRYSAVVIAGLGAAPTRRAAPMLGGFQRTAEVIVLPHGAPPRALVVRAKELTREVSGR